MDKIWQKIAPKEKILILGFGREGLSSYVFIRSHDKERILTIADASADVEHNPIFKDDSHVRFITGKKYLEHLNGFDLILKAPGISLPDPVLFEHRNTLSSQAALFLEAFRDQTIGVTGTKGKSTTSTFIHHFLKLSGKESLLLGNIGVPPFDMLGDIQPETVIVFELSSHMLQTVRVSPHIALALNIFPEHLDYYETMERYVASKAHIFEHQRKEDFLVTDDNIELEEIIKKTGTHAKRISWNETDAECAPLERGGELFIKKGEEEIPFYTLDTKTSVNGHHVLRGLLLGAIAGTYAGAEPSLAKQALETFQGLSHRLQNIGVWKGITFINDSISTIPESALAALRAFPKTNVLILGGLDRGISYEKLIATIREMPDLYVLLIDETGERIYAELLPHQADPKKYFLLPDLEAAVKKCYDLLGNGGLVLLSPAAASYSQFKNFEERGKAFEEYAKKYGI